MHAKSVSKTETLGDFCETDHFNRGRPYIVASVAIALVLTVVQATMLTPPASDLTLPRTLLAVLLTLTPMGVVLSIVAAYRLSRSPDARNFQPCRDDLSNASIGLGAPFSSRESPMEAVVRSHQLAHVGSQLKFMMAINIANAAVVCLALWGSVSMTLLLPWAGSIVGLSVAGLWAAARFRRNSLPRSVSKRTLRRVSLHAGIRGLLWGMAFFLFFPSAGPTGQLLLLGLSLGMIAGGVPALAPVPSAALLYGLGILVPTMLGVIGKGTTTHILLGSFGLTFAASLVMTVCQLYESFAGNIVAKSREAEQTATISLLLKEFETAASDWLWETVPDGTFIRLPVRMTDLMFVDRDGKRPLTFQALLGAPHVEGGASILSLVGEGKSFRDRVLKINGPSGEVFWISLAGSPRPDGGYRGVGSDITASMKAKLEAAQALERANRAECRLKDGIDALSAGLLLSDDNDRTIVANRKFYELLPSAELLKKSASFEDIVAAHAALEGPSGDARRVDWLREIAERRQSPAGAFDVEIAEHRWLRVEARPTSDGGLVTALVDISDIKHQEQALARQARLLADSNRELQQFATVASHDLQEPLRKIETFAKRLHSRSQAALDDESKLYMDRMLAASQRMRRLITDLLSYSRVGRSAQPFASVDIGEIVAHVVEDMSILVEERGARISHDCLGHIRGDATLLRQLMQNLMANAIKFTPVGVSPTITISRRTCADGGTEIQVADNGIGFDMQFHDQIFEIFQRLHGRDAYEGTGVGLATCRKIMERHGGTIRAESVPGAGSTFILAFPASSTVAELPVEVAMQRTRSAA